MHYFRKGNREASGRILTTRDAEQVRSIIEQENAQILPLPDCCTAHVQVFSRNELDSAERFRISEYGIVCPILFSTTKCEYVTCYIVSGTRALRSARMIRWVRRNMLSREKMKNTLVHAGSDFMTNESAVCEMRDCKNFQIFFWFED